MPPQGVWLPEIMIENGRHCAVGTSRMWHSLIEECKEPVFTGFDAAVLEAYGWQDLSRSVGVPPNTGSLALLDRKTGVPPVREDSASRLSADEPTGGPPVGPDRRDAMAEHVVAVSKLLTSVGHDAARRLDPSSSPCGIIPQHFSTFSLHCSKEHRIFQA
jgi:hypothetical protein